MDLYWWGLTVLYDNDMKVINFDIGDLEDLFWIIKDRDTSIMIQLVSKRYRTKEVKSFRNWNPDH